MIANYSICAACSELIDNSSGIWRDIDGHSFELLPSSDGMGFVYHRHAPFTDENYSSLGKYANLDSEILDSLAMHGYASDALGDQSTFGFYDLFSEYNAILYSRPDGSVAAVFYDSVELTNKAWESVVADYEEFDSEDDDYPCDCGAITYQCDCNDYAVPYEDDDWCAHCGGPCEL